MQSLRFARKNYLEAWRVCCTFTQCYPYTTTKTPVAVTLMDHLRKTIKATGPITVANYMKEALTNPIWGYYMKKDVFGKHGDFTTSPEISQMFGELIAVWLILQWSQLGKPDPFQLVELGPGRGTLMADIVSVFQQLNIKEKFNIHFVEVSGKMMELQRQSLNISTSDDTIENTNIKVHWHPTIQDVPKGLSFYVAHEFFDALPVHLFQKVDGKWREVLVNLAKSQQILEFVIAPGPSPLAMSLLDNTSSDVTKCELCPEAAVIISCISQNIAEHGGGALVIDYGEEMSDRFSLRGFKNHELVSDVLETPGLCDLTANVDFSFLKRHTHEKVKSFGPVTQKSFLLQMGIRERLQALMRNANELQTQQLLSSYDYLTSPQQMGEKFKLLALSSDHKNVPPGFA